MSYAAQPCSYLQYSFARILLTQSIQLSKIVRDKFFVTYRYAPWSALELMLKRQNPGRLLRHADTDVRAGLKPAFLRVGGAERDRTVDPLLAKQVLSQLSYSPIRFSIAEARDMVGLGRFELPTSPLSGVRSSQLSYRPGLAGARGPIGSLARAARSRDRTTEALSKGFEDTVERADRLRRS